MEKLLRVPPPLIALALLATGYGLGRLLPALPTLPNPLSGLILMGCGGLLSASALFHFWRLKTSFIPQGEPSVLVVQGPYTWTRNPMYLGLLTAVAGVSLYFGSLPMWLAPVLFVQLINRVHITHEESVLERIFGERYTAYRGRVSRWI